MADVYNRNDPNFVNNPNYTWVEGAGWVEKSNVSQAPSPSGSAPTSSNAPAPSGARSTGNIGDRYDPTFSSTQGFRWDEGRGRWVGSGGNARDPNDPTFSADPGYKWVPDANAGGGQWVDTTNVAARTATFGENISGPLGAGRVHTGAGGRMGEQGMYDALQGRMGGSGIPETAFGVGSAERARGAQMQILDQLLAQAAGTAPSPAQMMLQQAADRNLSDAAAMAQSQRGLGATAAQSQVSGQRAEIGQQASRDAGILRLQEQMQATQAAGRVAEGLRGQDVAQEQARAQVKLASDNLRQTLMQKYMEMGLSQAEADRRARMDMEKARATSEIELARLRQSANIEAEKLMREDRQYATDTTKDVLKALGIGLLMDFGEG